MYMESSTVRKSAGKVKVWMLMDFVEVQQSSFGPFRSDKYQEEFDCKGGMHRSLYISFRDGSMGSGNVVWEQNAGAQAEWRPVVPDTANYDVMQKICGR